MKMIFSRDISSMFRCRGFISIVLSLSSPAIYAEVPVKSIESTNAITKNAMHAQNVKHESRPARSSAKADATWALHAEQWDMARSGETLMELPVLKALMTAWLSEQQRMIEIQYPGGEDGEFWVQELTDWLVSLGIPSKYMVTTPGSGADDVIKFNIIK